jgi:hypothetical protein
VQRDTVPYISLAISTGEAASHFNTDDSAFSWEFRGDTTIRNWRLPSILLGEG